jgi:hypothetical protein
MAFLENQYPIPKKDFFYLQYFLMIDQTCSSKKLYVVGIRWFQVEKSTLNYSNKIYFHVEINAQFAQK